MEPSSTFTVYPLWLPRLAEIIPDHSTIGAYSNSLQARLYKQTGQSVPNILMLAAFGGPEIANTMRHFMSLLEMAERELSKEHFAVQDSVHPKDKGPFLYWLANERNLDLHGRFHTRACLLYEWEGHTCLAPFWTALCPRRRTTSGTYSAPSSPISGKSTTARSASASKGGRQRGTLSIGTTGLDKPWLIPVPLPKKLPQPAHVKLLNSES